MISRIYKTKNIVAVSPDDTLHAIMPYFTSSHDAAFVFENPAKQIGFMGVVSPYYCVIKKSYPANTKAKHCLIHPPKIDINASLEKTAQAMMQTKIHYLPVFENDVFKGIISARRLLTAIVDEAKLEAPIQSILSAKKRPLVSVYENEMIAKALPLFKKHSISKLVVLTEDMKLAGMFSYYDIISYLSTPKERQGFSSRTGNKVPALHRKVKNFAKKNVLTLTAKDSIKDACKMILKEQIGSVLILDPEKHPVGIVTTRDILGCYGAKTNPFRVDVVVKGASDNSLKIIHNFIDDVSARFSTNRDIDRAKVVVKERKLGGVFEAIFSIIKRGAPQQIFRKEGKNLFKVLQDIKEKSKRVAAKK